MLGRLTGNPGLQPRRRPAEGRPAGTRSSFDPHSVEQHNARDAQRRNYYHKAFKKKQPKRPFNFSLSQRPGAGRAGAVEQL